MSSIKYFCVKGIHKHRQYYAGYNVADVRDHVIKFVANHRQWIEFDELQRSDIPDGVLINMVGLSPSDKSLVVLGL